MFHENTLMRGYRIRVKHPKGLAYSFNVADQQDVGERPDQRHGRDIHQSRTKAVVLRKVTDDQRYGDPARPPTKLNTPPVRPIRRIGARDDTSDQVMEAKPFPKNATAIRVMIHTGSLV